MCSFLLFNDKLLNTLSKSFVPFWINKNFKQFFNINHQSTTKINNDLRFRYLLF